MLKFTTKNGKGKITLMGGPEETIADITIAERILGRQLRIIKEKEKIPDVIFEEIEKIVMHGFLDAAHGIAPNTRYSDGN